MEQKQDYPKIVSIEAAFEAAGYDLAAVPQMFAGVPEKHRMQAVKNFKREVIAAAINGEWQADWSDNQQKKWFPWWWVSRRESGSPVVSLSLNDCFCVSAIAYVGPRQVFETKEQAQHYANHFRDFDEEFYSPNI